MTWGTPGYNPLPPPAAGSPGTAQPLSGGGSATPLSSPFDDARNAYLAYNGPTLQQYQQSNLGAYRNMGLDQVGLGLNQQGLQQQYAANMGDLSTQMDTNSISQQRSLMDQAAYNKMMGFNTDVFNAQAAGLANNAYKQEADINSQATANGAYVASGTNANRHFAYNDFLDQYGALAGNYKQQQEMLNMRAGNAGSQAQILERESQNLGMKAGQLQDTLNNGLAKLGLANQVSVGNLLDGIQNNNLQALQLYYQILQQAGQYATAVGQK